MKLLRVGAATLNQTPLDWDGNSQRIRAAVEQAKHAGVGLLCLPELCITGYGCEDAFLSPGTHQMALEVLRELLPCTRGLVTCFGLPVAWHKAVYNTCCLVADGRVIGLVAKRALAGDGLHYEPRWFKPWPEGRRTRWLLLGETFPVGDLVFDVGGVRIGFEICEDAWTAERPGANLAQSAVDVILNPSASHFAFGKHLVRRRLVLEGARAFGVAYLYSNLLGNEAGRVIYDGDALIATERGIVDSTRRFCFSDHSMATAIVDVELSRTKHAWRASFQPTVDEAADACVQVGFVWPVTDVPTTANSGEEGAAQTHSKFEEFTRSVALALFDYLRKSRSNGFVVSLSGGADSAAIACLVHLMVRLARIELGAEGFCRRLAHVPGIEPDASDREWTARLLTTVYQHATVRRRRD